MVKNKTFLDVNDVCETLGCAKSKAYSIIRKLNAEMQQNGYITISGKINAKYFYERIYNGETDRKDVGD